jgi:hypothetical protein
MVEKLKKILKEEYGINSIAEFIEAAKNCEGVDISIFTMGNFKKENTEVA